MWILGVELCALAIDYAEDNSPTNGIRAPYLLYPPMPIRVITQVHNVFLARCAEAEVPMGAFFHVAIFEAMWTFHTSSFPPVGIRVPLGFGVDG